MMKEVSDLKLQMRLS